MLFPLDTAQQYLVGIFAELQRDGSILSWPDRGGISTLRVEPISHRTSDGMTISEVVSLTHRSKQLADLSARVRGQLNRLATQGALIPVGDSGEGVWTSKVGIFSTDQAAAERLYAPLLCGQAAIMGWHAQCLAQGFYELDPNLCPLTGTDEPVRVDQSEFEKVMSQGDQLGLVGSGQEGSYTVEYPWDPGAKSQLFRLEAMRDVVQQSVLLSDEELAAMVGRTSLLRIRTLERHSLYGNGVLATLELPLPVDREDTPALVDELNLWELSGPDLPPLFGAWCIGPRAPTFVTFVPTMSCVPGLVMGLASWARGRHARVCQWLGGSRVRH